MALKHLYIYLVIIIVTVIIILIYIGTSKIGADTQDMRCSGSMMKELETQLNSTDTEFDFQRYEALQSQLAACRENR